MSEEISDYLKKIIDKIVSEGYFSEIIVFPDLDSIVSASLIIRLASVNGYEIGVVSSENIDEISDRTLSIGFSRARTGIKGYFIGKNRVFSSREDRIILIPYTHTLTRYLVDVIMRVYSIPRELRSLALAAYLYTISENNMLHNLSDESVREATEIFGVDATRVVIGLKLQGYYDESYIDKNLLSSIDPYIPSVSGRRDAVDDIMRKIGSGRGREYIEKVAQEINTRVNMKLLEIGNKPYYEPEYPFTDPYEAAHCLNIHANRDLVLTTLYIATGVSGISLLSLKCREEINRIIYLVDRILSKETYEIVVHKINNNRATEIRIDECSREILYETYLILRDLKIFQEPILFKCRDRYLYPLRKPIYFSRDVIKSLRGLFIESDDIKKIIEVYRSIEDSYRD
ncbi:MAG: hypothetical protein ABWJ42_02880 [Sulfolobales archaeon]